RAQRDAREPADRVLDRHRAFRPGRSVRGGSGLDDFDLHAFGIGEREQLVAEALALSRRDAFRVETFFPEAERTLRYCIADLDRFAPALPAGGHVLPEEEGEGRAGRTGLVAVIEMPRAGVVEVDRALHEAKAE